MAIIFMKYVVDIDGTICKTKGSDYENSKPIKERIQKMNELFDEGHEIHYWTARGGNSGINWAVHTKEQFAKWGVKYTTLAMKKPVYDIWIDDKATNADDFFAK
jgi:histidinol phosphatase-like enzyme